jgi:hypothetical protein
MFDEQRQQWHASSLWPQSAVAKQLKKLDICAQKYFLLSL